MIRNTSDFNKLCKNIDNLTKDVTKGKYGKKSPKQIQSVLKQLNDLKNDFERNKERFLQFALNNNDEKLIRFIMNDGLSQIDISIATLMSLLGNGRNVKNNSNFPSRNENANALYSVPSDVEIKEVKSVKDCEDLCARITTITDRINRNEYANESMENIELALSQLIAFNIYLKLNRENILNLVIDSEDERLIRFITEEGGNNIGVSIDVLATLLLADNKINNSNVGNNDLAGSNLALRNEIVNTPAYRPSPAAQQLGMGIYAGGPFPKEFMDSQTHQHQIFDQVYLGDLRAYYSVDPNFIERYQISDEADQIVNQADIEQELRNEALMHLNQQIDRKGCTDLGIKYVLSATQFKPSDEVEVGDWSRFEPRLGQFDIKRKQLLVDDDEFAWDGIEPLLDQAFSFIDQSRIEGKPCLIHCVKGASRSVTVLTAYLMNRCRVTMDQAFNFILTKRTVAELKPDMKRGLSRYQNKLGIE